MSNSPLLVGGSPSAAADMPPPVDYYLGSDNSDSDQDDDHPFDEPQFLIHAVDDDRPHPPIQHNHHPAPALQAAAAAAAQDQVYLYREAARLERLNFFLILPQAVLCVWIVGLGIGMILMANDPAESVTDLVSWVTTCSALVISFSLASLLLSLLAVYFYDGWPCLNGWLR